MKVGIQLLSKDYKFNKEKNDAIFQPDDISSFYPVVKSHPPKCSDGKELYDAAKFQFSQGKKIF